MYVQTIALVSVSAGSLERAVEGRKLPFMIVQAPKSLKVPCNAKRRSIKSICGDDAAWIHCVHGIAIRLACIVKHAAPNLTEDSYNLVSFHCRTALVHERVS